MSVRDRARTAGAAAHEINQPLSVILGLAQMMLSTAPEDSPERQDLTYISDAAVTIREILGQMESVKNYSTRSYVGDASIVDFKTASGDGTANPGENQTA